MNGLKKEILTIVILAVMAMTGIYVANAAPATRQTNTVEVVN